MSAVRALHLFSNYKFTGPADPAMLLAAHLRERGVEILFAAGRGRGEKTDVAALARARGIPTLDLLELRRHGHPLPLARDVLRLRRYLVEEPVDVVHTHLANDHLIAILASDGRIPVVRTLYDAAPPSGLRASVCFPRTARVLVFARSVRERVIARYPRLEGRVDVVDPAVDLERFRPGREAEPRRTWGVPDEAFVVGVVARMQTHRLFPELIEGFSRAARDDDGLRLVILGRGTHQETVAHEPARASDVADQILFPGYVSGEEYPRALTAFDALIFLVPGSDGTCRAAREALVSGVPVIASRRGLLPELIEDGKTGLLLPDESPGAMAEALARLRRDDELRRRLSAGAEGEARRRFDPGAQAALVAELYATLGSLSR